MTLAPPAQRRSTALPAVLGVPAALGLLLLLLPLLGLLVRAPWRDLPRLLAEPAVAQALRLSLVSAAVATALSLLLGVPLAWVLARLRFPGRRLLRALVTLPLVLPPVVGGLALLVAFGRRGLFGPLLELGRAEHPVHDHRGRARRDVRRDAVPGRHRRGRAQRRPTGASRRPPRPSGPGPGRPSAA